MTVIKMYFRNFLVGHLYIRFEDRSLISTNLEALTDNTSYTCTTFQRINNISISYYTQFRVQKSAGQIGDTNVTITGSKLGCGYNLYVTVLTTAQSTTWLGRWTGCTLLETIRYGNMESCSYWCKSPGYWKELQVLMIARTSEELDWELYNISITSHSTG